MATGVIIRQCHMYHVIILLYYINYEIILHFNYGLCKIIVSIYMSETPLVRYTHE